MELAQKLQKGSAWILIMCHIVSSSLPFPSRTASQSIILCRRRIPRTFTSLSRYHPTTILPLMNIEAFPNRPHTLIPSLSLVTIHPSTQTPTVTRNHTPDIILQSEIHGLSLLSLPSPAVAAPLQRHAPRMAISSSHPRALCTTPPAATANTIHNKSPSRILGISPDTPTMTGL